MADRAATLQVNLEANASKLIDGLGGAASATQKWAEEAGRAVEKVKTTIAGVNVETTSRRFSGEVAKMIALQHQLDVARAAGDRQAAASLEAQITQMQRIRALTAKGLDKGTASGLVKA